MLSPDFLVWKHVGVIYTPIHRGLTINSGVIKEMGHYTAIKEMGGHFRNDRERSATNPLPKEQ